MIQKRKPTTLSLTEKVNLLKITENDENKKQDVAKEFGIPIFLLEANMSGTEKSRPLLIDKSNKPRYFKQVKSLLLDN